MNGDTKGNSMGKNKRISLTLAIKDYECIERLVASGRYKSVDDFVQIAVRKLIAEEIGGVELDEKALKSIRKTFGIT